MKGYDSFSFVALLMNHSAFCFIITYLTITIKICFFQNSDVITKIFCHILLLETLVRSINKPGIIFIKLFILDISENDLDLLHYWISERRGLLHSGQAFNNIWPLEICYESTSIKMMVTHRRLQIQASHGMCRTCVLTFVVWKKCLW